MRRTFEFTGERFILRGDMSDYPIEAKAGSLYHYHTKESYDEAQAEIARLRKEVERLKGHKFTNCTINLKGHDYYAFAQGVVDKYTDIGNMRTKEGFIPRTGEIVSLAVYNDGLRVFLKDGVIDADGLHIVSDAAMQENLNTAHNDAIEAAINAAIKSDKLYEAISAIRALKR